jgi:hypothetical protein
MFSDTKSHEATVTPPQRQQRLHGHRNVQRVRVRSLSALLIVVEQGDAFAFAISFRFLLCVRAFYMDHAVLVSICVDLIFVMLWRGGGRKTRRVERDRPLVRVVDFYYHECHHFLVASRNLRHTCRSVLEVNESCQSPWALMLLPSFSSHA